MVRFIQRFFILATIIGSCFYSVSAVVCNGCVDLDEHCFEKTITHFPYSIVKFDSAFPYGPTHDAFSDFAQKSNKLSDDLLIASVGVKDYGFNENKELSERYLEGDRTLPYVILFKGNTSDFVLFPSDLEVSASNFQKFVSINTPLYLGLQGCLKEFNSLARGYADLPDEEQLAKIAKAEQLAEKLTKQIDKERAKSYLIFMKKIHKNGYNFVEEEANRLQRISGGKLSAAKKEELGEKLNILLTFRITKPGKAEEEQVMESATETKETEPTVETEPTDKTEPTEELEPTKLNEPTKPTESTKVEL